MNRDRGRPIFNILSPTTLRDGAMKPLPSDHRHRLLIGGDELRELKRHTGSMAEAFGLDRKIENHKGTRPITLYRWDLECLMDVIDLALKDERDYPDKSTPEYQALQKVGERFHQEYDAVYGHEKSSPPGKAVAPAKRLATSSPVAASGEKPGSRKAPSKSTKKQATDYQLKITLADIKPPVWRRVEVKDCTLTILHEIVQIVMGWDGYHLWAFEIGGEQYGEDPTGEMEMTIARKVKLSQIVQAGLKKLGVTDRPRSRN
jgi:Plasmid pRiA4b ORF-3-like protein